MISKRNIIFFSGLVFLHLSNLTGIIGNFIANIVFSIDRKMGYVLPHFMTIDMIDKFLKTAEFFFRKGEQWTDIELYQKD